MSSKSKKAKQKGETNKKQVAKAMNFDDKLTRRMPLQEMSLPGTGKLGLTMRDHPLGVMIIRIAEGSALDSELQCGDVLVSACDAKLTGCHQASSVIREHLANGGGKPVELTYYKSADAEAAMLAKRKAPKLIVFSDLEAGTQIGLTIGSHPLGVVCVAIPKDLPAYNAGLREGDVIVTIAGQVIKAAAIRTQGSPWPRPTAHP